MSSPSLLAELRSATEKPHQILDDALSVDAITASPDSFEDYLTCHGAALSEVVSRIDWDTMAILELPDLWLRRARYERFLARFSGGAPPRYASRGLVDQAEMIGILYVLEGSVHGGSILVRALLAKFPAANPDLTEYLSGFGAETPVLWRAFIAWLHGLTMKEADLEQACRGACWAFKAFSDHLNPQSPTS